MKLIILSIVTFSIIVTSGTAFAMNNETTDWNKIEDLSKTHESKKLSRRKRFLIFPDGSSFQLGLYCY